MSRLRLLLIDREFPPNPHGGIGSYNYALANRLWRYGPEISVLTIGPGTQTIVTSTDFGRVISIPYRPLTNKLSRYCYGLDDWRLGQVIRRVVDQIIKANEINLIEIPSTGGYGQPISRAITDVPLVTRFHGSLGKWPASPDSLRAFAAENKRLGRARTPDRLARALRRCQWNMERSQLLASSQITFPSGFSRQWLGAQAGLEVNGYPLLPNGVDTTELQSVRAAARPPRNRKRVFFVGRCNVPKGASVLLRALPQILQHEPTAEVVFAGPLVDPQIADQLHGLKHQYPDRVCLPGRMDHASLLFELATAAVLVHPSFYEVSPMAVLEAMALGVPVVASNTGPLPEIVNHAETGLLFNVGDAAALERAVLSVLSADGNCTRARREASLARASNLFAMDRLILDLLQIYADVQVQHG